MSWHCSRICFGAGLRKNLNEPSVSEDLPTWPSFCIFSPSLHYPALLSGVKNTWSYASTT
jgi:hypothetical protein